MTTAAVNGFACAALAFVVAVVLTPVFARWARERNLLDHPNARSSHVVATPRTGGSALILGTLSGLGLLHLLAGVSSPLAVVLLASCAVALAGLLDDLRSLSAAVRLVVQIAVASSLVAWLGPPAWPVALPGALAAVLSVVWIAGLTNAYNFMDGVDGIAGLQAVIAGIGWTILGGIIGETELAVAGVVVACSAAGFLLHNWQPATVFMGDAGSAFLGFFFAAVPLATVSADPRTLLWAALLTWPFLFDSAFTLGRRIVRRENIFAAHRSHLYQRLTTTGVSHAGVSLLYALLTLPGVAGAILLSADVRGAAGAIVLVVPVSAAVLWRAVVSREAAQRAALRTGR